jgi:hypothetical protein
MTKLFKLTTKNITDIKSAIDTNGKLETAIGNHRANFYVTLTGMFQASGVEMDVFKAALATGLNAYFGRADRQSEAQVKAKATPMPQVVIDWAGRVQQTVTLGIKPATIKTMSEGEMKKEIALVKAAAKQGVTRAAIVKAAGGAKAPLKAVEKAIKAATIKADPSAEKERIALVAVMAAIKNGLNGLDHAARMNYLTLLTTTAKSNPAEVAA